MISRESSRQLGDDRIQRSTYVEVAQDVDLLPYLIQAAQYQRLPSQRLFHGSNPERFTFRRARRSASRRCAAIAF